MSLLCAPASNITVSESHRVPEQNFEGMMAVLFRPIQRGGNIKHATVLQRRIGDHVFQAALNFGLTNVAAQRRGSALFVAHYDREIPAIAQCFG